MMRSIGVVGGGFIGACTSLEALARGHRVVLYEACTSAGGAVDNPRLNDLRGQISGAF